LATGKLGFSWKTINKVVCVCAVLKYLFGFLGKEEAEDHEIGEWQEEVDVRVILVLLHKERRPAQTNVVVSTVKLNKRLCDNGSLHPTVCLFTSSFSAPLSYWCIKE